MSHGNLRCSSHTRRATRWCRRFFLLLASHPVLLALFHSRRVGTRTSYFTDASEPSQQETEGEPRPEISFPSPFAGLGDSNRCSDFDMSLFTKGWSCGSPLSQPCFDFNRCRGSNKIYVYNFNCSLSDSSALLAADEAQRATGWTDPHYIDWVFRDAARDAGVLASTYESACLFVHVTRGGRGLCAVDSPLWSEGSNHVMVDFGDTGRESRPEVADSYAMDAASNMHSCWYRSGYDVSLPLGPEKYFLDLAVIPPLDRQFFLTFKGTLYLVGHGSEERLSISSIHDETNGVIMSTRCNERHGDHLLPEFADLCVGVKARYDDYDYGSLMNTTFGVVPAGRSPGTYRLAEIMGAGVIPVFVARDLVLPFTEQIEWASFSFSFSPEEAESIVPTLRRIPKTQLEEMQRLSLEAYQQLFGGRDRSPNGFELIAKKLINVLVQRIDHRGGR